MTSKVSPRELLTGKMESRVGPETKYFVNGNGRRIHSSYWSPSDTSSLRGLVFLCHGFGEHLQWYEELALRLAGSGVLAFGHDHVGHGRSEGVRGHVDSADEYINDVLRHCDDVRSQHPGLPTFMVGHSMGGMIAIRVAMTRPEMFDGVVLMGPAISPNPREATPARIFLARLVAKICPHMPVAKIRLQNVTRDEDMLSRLRKDPLRYNGGCMARWAVASLECLGYIEANMSDIEWPFLILHGENDLLCETEGSRTLHKNAKSKDKTIKIFPKAYHHLYLELPDVRRQALQDTVEWITHRLEPSKH
ncbi:monoglyceride lipase-like [Oratosquilla oratoria]|uniref:monoglyceride lipase-like n=1 Tax=Oratosquilla oratoria TaxID=337810 RepID=UPI003F766394